MKALTCEMCGSTNLIKEDGVFVCQSCNTKYSVEEAKKMMIDGTVEVAGTVKIDTSSELTNLYEIARRAKDTENSENALKYYDMILVKDPNSWEANFYVVFFKAMSCKISDIYTSASLISNSFGSVLGLVKNSLEDKSECDIVIQEMYAQTKTVSNMLCTAAISHYNDIDASVRDQFLQDYVLNTTSSTQILYDFGDKLLDVFGDTYSAIAVESWKIGIDMQNLSAKSLTNGESLTITLSSENIIKYSEKIQSYDPNFETPEIEQPSGATGAVIMGIIAIIVIALWLFSDFIFLM